MMQSIQQNSKSYGSRASPVGGGLVGALAVLKFVLPFVLVSSVWELHRDEYLYYAQGQHIALGYLECPPLLGWLGSISSLLGGSYFWVKFWPSLFGSFTLIVAAAIAKELGGKLFAQILAAVGIILSAYLRTNFLFQPGFLEIFFWTLSAYYLLRLINTQKTKYYYLLSVALAAGWWSKYSVLFFVAALVVAIVLTYHRKLLANKHFWLAALMGLLLIIPNILWQYSHNWPLVHHMQELQQTQLQYINKGTFIKEQFLMLLPVAFVWISGLIWLLFYKKYRLISYAYLGVILLLMLGSGKGYYALGAYPMLLAAGGVYLEKTSRRRLWLRPVFVAIIFVLSFPFLFLLLPLQSPQNMAATNTKYNLKEIGILKWEDQQNHALQQDFADMIGWKELASKAERNYDSLSAKGYQNIVVYCSSYGQAGALQYYAQNPLFKQKVISRNGTFLLWIPQPLSFNHILLVDDEWPEKEEVIFQHFEKITLLDSVANPLSRQLGDKIFLLEKADSTAVRMVNTEIAEKRRIFSRS
jgi:hypothetical protein